MNHAEEAVDQFIIAGCDGSVNLEVAEPAFDAVLLRVERAVMFDLHTPV